MLAFGTVLTALGVFLSVVTAATYSNPLRQNGPDPFIVYYAGYYYFTTTTDINLQITRATTLEGLKTGTRKTVWTPTNSTLGYHVWAPEIHQINGIWYMYFSSGAKSDSLSYRSQVLKGGASPWDAYAYVGVIVSDWSIDGTVLAVHGKKYYVWSCEPTAGNTQSICIALMNSATSIQTPKSVISNPTNSWETVSRANNEGPQPMYWNGKTYITYSASSCKTANYSLGLLTYDGSTDPLKAAAWAKKGPVFTSANGNYGTGHNCIFLSPDKTQLWNAYHAVSNSTGACDTTRYTMADIVTWHSDGTPNFGKPDKVGTVLQGPSGE